MCVWCRTGPPGEHPRPSVLLGCGTGIQLSHKLWLPHQPSQVERHASMKPLRPPLSLSSDTSYRGSSFPMTTQYSHLRTSLTLEREGCTRAWMCLCDSLPKDFSIFPFKTRMYVSRVHTHSRLCQLSISILQKLHQIGFSLGAGSEVKVHQPWVTGEDGYTSRVTGTLQNVVVTSDLSFPHLASADTLKVSVGVFSGEVASTPVYLQLDVALSFPRVWNGTQHWDMNLTTSGVQLSILFSYIDFLNGECLPVSEPASRCTSSPD